MEMSDWCKRIITEGLGLGFAGPKKGVGFCRHLTIYSRRIGLEVCLKIDPEIAMLVANMMPGWWFGTFFIFPYIGNNHPIWLIFFQRGRSTTNQAIFCSENDANPLLVGGLEHEFYFSISYMGCHPSHWGTHIFRGVGQPPISIIIATINHSSPLIINDY